MKPWPDGMTRIEISPRTILFTLGVLILLWVLVHIRVLLMVLFLACLLAAALYPGVAWLKTRRFPRQLSILVFYIVFVLLAAGIISLMANILLDEGGQFLENLPRYTESASAFLEELPLPLEFRQNIFSLLSRFLSNVITQLIQFLVSGLNYLVLVVQSMFSVVTILVFAFFLMSNPQHFENTLLQMIPPSKRAGGHRLLAALALRLGTYVRGQLLVMTAVGILTWLGLSIVGVPYAFVLGLLAFLLEIVPILGPLLTTALGVLVALGQDPMLALWAFLVFFAVQQLENYVLIPYVLGKTVGLHPFWILFSVLAGGALSGIVGVLLAVPIAVTVSLVLHTFYIPAMAGNKSSAPP